MGNHKQKWTAEEEEALKAGVKKHGMGKWKTILVDPDFATALTHRSNIDLKVNCPFIYIFNYFFPQFVIQDLIQFMACCFRCF